MGRPALIGGRGAGGYRAMRAVARRSPEAQPLLPDGERTGLSDTRGYFVGQYSDSVRAVLR
jgi:hypothetical protein